MSGAAALSVGLAGVGCEWRELLHDVAAAGEMKSRPRGVGGRRASSVVLLRERAGESDCDSERRLGVADCARPGLEGWELRGWAFAGIGPVDGGMGPMKSLELAEFEEAAPANSASTPCELERDRAKDEAEMLVDGLRVG